ncbi:hypothetical protein WG906_03260 [Pedobacter sp. P351]|uniref:hypothetical protein n=1 Tax=Pedobacter superstes TaxID=3133441 RepID=UPI00309CB279
MKKRKVRRISISEPSHNSKSKKAGFGYEMPPDFDDVSIYFNQKGQAQIASSFYEYFQNCQWRTKTGTPLRNWKVVATDWIYNYCQSLKLAKRKLDNIL